MSILSLPIYNLIESAGKGCQRGFFLFKIFKVPYLPDFFVIPEVLTCVWTGLTLFSMTLSISVDGLIALRRLRQPFDLYLSDFHERMIG